MTIKTVKSSGGDYTTLQAALDACPADITAATGTNETWEIECYASVTGSSQITIPSRVTDSTHFIRVYTPQSERHNGVSGGFAISVNNTILSCIDILSVDVKIEGIRFVTASQSSSSIYSGAAASRNVEIAECLFLGDLVYACLRIINCTGGTFKLRNCIRPHKIATDGAAIIIYASSGSGYSVYAYNCTAVSDQTTGFPRLFWNNAGITAVAKNCIADFTGGGNGTCFNGTWSSSSNNCSSDNTAPGTSSKTSVHPTFVDTANNDQHLAAGDTVAKDSGVDLSGDANYPFSIDIDGQTRSGTWDMGADEYQAAGVGVPKTTKLAMLGVG